MESILKMLQVNPYVYAATILIAIASLFFAVYYGIKSNKYKRMTYLKKTNRIVSLKKTSIKSLHLYYEQQEIEDISITKFALWNSGNEVLKMEDLVSQRPLEIMIKEGQEKTTQILDCSVDYVTDECTLLKITPFVAAAETVVTVYYRGSFEYMAPDDGMIIQIIHTGKADDIYLDCKIKGGKEFSEIRDPGLTVTTNNKFVNILLSLPYSLLMAVDLAVFLITFITMILPPPLSTYTLVGLITVLLLVSIVYRINSIRIPKKIKEKL